MLISCKLLFLIEEKYEIFSHRFDIYDFCEQNCSNYKNKDFIIANKASKVNIVLENQRATKSFKCKLLSFAELGV